MKANVAAKGRLVDAGSVACRLYNESSLSFIVTFKLIDDPRLYSFWVFMSRPEASRISGLTREPPEGVGRGAPGYFTPRSLRHESKAWRDVVRRVMHQLQTQRAFSKATAALRAQMRETDRAVRLRQAKARAALRMARAAPALIAACRRALKDNVRGPYLSNGTVDALCAALKKAGAS